jgi:hypothetical protein
MGAGKEPEIKTYTPELTSEQKQFYDQLNALISGMPKSIAAPTISDSGAQSYIQQVLSGKFPEGTATALARPIQEESARQGQRIASMFEKAGAGTSSAAIQQQGELGTQTTREVGDVIAKALLGQQQSALSGALGFGQLGMQAQMAPYDYQAKLLQALTGALGSLPGQEAYMTRYQPSWWESTSAGLGGLGQAATGATGIIRALS